MAQRFWRGGTASWDGTAGSKWAATAGGATGASVPDATTDVFFDATSTGTVTIASGALCRSVDCNGFSGTWSITNFTLLVGDGTAGASNRIFRLSSTMTIAGNTAGNITLQSTSGTQQDVNFAGKNINGIFTFAGAGSSYDVSSATGGSGQTCVHSAGTLSFSGGGFSVNAGGFTTNSGSTRTLTLGTATITIAGNWTLTTAGLTFSSATGSTITISAANVTFAGGGITTYGTVQWTGSTIALAVLSGANTFVNLKLAPTVGGKADSLNIQANQTVTTTFTVTGVARSTQILLYTVALGTTETVTAAGVSLTNVDFMDFIGAGAATWSGTLLGDCQGNSGVTFQAAQPQFWIGGTGSQSSATKYSQSTGGANNGRVPLPQDNLTFDASSGSGTATFDMPRICKTLDASNSSVTTFAESVMTLGHAVYGNISFKSGMTLTLNSDALSLRGRSTQTITMNTNSINGSVNVQPVTGSYTCQDNFAVTGAATQALTIATGTFDANGFTVSTPTFATSGSATTKFGGAAWTITGGGGGTAYTVANANTLVPGATVITFTSTSGSANILGGTTQANNPSITFDGVGGTWTFGGAATFANVILTNGTISSSVTLTFTSFASSNSNVRTITIGGGTLTLTGVAGWDTTTTTNLTNNITAGTIVCSGTNAQFYGGGLTFKAVTMNGAAVAYVKGANTFTTFTRTGTATQHEALGLYANQTCTTSFVCNGNAGGFRVLIGSDSEGTTRTITAAAVTITNCDFRDITGAGAGTWSGTLVGDCRGNSGISFAVGQNNFWRSVGTNASTAASWSLTNGGGATGRCPLPQDTAKFASAGSGTCTYDMGRLPAMDFTGSTLTSITFPYDATFTGIVEMYGSFVGSAAVTFTWNASNVLILESRDAKTFTQNSAALPAIVGVRVIGGSWTLGGDLTSTTTGWNVLAGTFSDGGFNMSVKSLQHPVDAYVRTITLTGTVTVNLSTGTVWDIRNDANTTVTMTAATLAISTSSASTRTVSHAKGTLGTITLSGGGAGAVIFDNGTATNLTCGTLNLSNGTTLSLAAGSTTTVNTAINFTGTAGTHVALISTGAFATLSSGGTVTVSYTDLTNNHAAGASINFHDINGIDNGGNANWVMDQQVTINESIGATETLAFVISETLTESAGITDPAASTVAVLLPNDAEGVVDSSIVSPVVIPLDSIGISDVASDVVASTVNESVGLVDSAVAVVTVLTTDLLGVTDSSSAGGGAVVADAVGVVDATSSGITETITDSEGILDSVVGSSGASLYDSLGLRDQGPAIADGFDRADQPSLGSLWLPVSAVPFDYVIESGLATVGANGLYAANAVDAVDVRTAGSSFVIGASITVASDGGVGALLVGDPADGSTWAGAWVIGQGGGSGTCAFGLGQLLSLSVVSSGVPIGTFRVELEVDPVAGDLQLYVDGVFAGSASVAPSLLVPTTVIMATQSVAPFWAMDDFVVRLLEPQGPIVQPVVIVNDTEGAADSMIPSGGVVIADAVGATDSLASAITMVATDGLGITESMSVVANVWMSEALGLTDNYSPEFQQQITDDAVGVVDAVSMVSAVTIADGVGVTDLRVAGVAVAVVDSEGILDRMVAGPSVNFSDVLGATDGALAALQVILRENEGLSDVVVQSVDVVLGDELGVGDLVEALALVTFIDTEGITDSIVTAFVTGLVHVHIDTTSTIKGRVQVVGFNGRSLTIKIQRKSQFPDVDTGRGVLP